MKKLSIDLVICTYNRAYSLYGTLHSIENLAVPENLLLSVLVINNNCTDNTNEILEMFSKSSKVKLITCLEKKQGLIEARRTGFIKSNAEWIAFIDDDCILDKNWLLDTFSFIKDHPDCGAFGGKIVLAFETNAPDYVHRIKYAYAGKSLGNNPFKRNWVAGLGMTVQKEALSKTGWHLAPILKDRIGNRLISGGDMEMGIRIAQSNEVWYSPDPIITHIIPLARTNKDYIKKMLRGLGASRHNVAAITWKKSYPVFILYEFIFFIGFFIQSIIESAREFLFEKSRLGLAVLIQPGLGWLDASIQLFKSRKNKNEFILNKVT